MARDFASRQHKRTKAAELDKGVEATKVRGAVARSAEEKPIRGFSFWGKLPGWGWLAMGLVIGFTVAQLSQTTGPTPLQEKPPLAIIKSPPVATKTSDKKAGTVSSEAAAQQSPRFDFYTLLPESEVVAPEVEAYKSTPREAENLPRFMLQVGSFRSAADANKLQERLKSLGYDQIRVSEVETGSGDIWHRVQIGPYQDRRLMARVQNNLAKAGLDFMLFRLRDEP